MSNISQFIEANLGLLSPAIATSVQILGAKAVEPAVNTQLQALFTIPADAHDRIMGGLPKELAALAEEKRQAIADAMADYTILATCSRYGIMPDSDENEYTKSKGKSKDKPKEG